MQRLNLIGIICIPVSLLVSGIGMLWLTKFSSAEGGFYDRLLSHTTDWVGSHLVLLVSTCMLIPAAISISSAVEHKKGSMLASVGTSLVCVTSLLLAGQYAIDLVMPLIARAGGSALDVHRELSSYAVTKSTLLRPTTTGFYRIVVDTLSIISSEDNLRVPLCIISRVVGHNHFWQRFRTDSIGQRGDSRAWH